MIPRCLKVLIIEDNPNEGELVRNCLEGMDFAFIINEIRNINNLKNILEEFEPDLVLSDYSLKGVTGLEALEIVREYDPFLPFIIVTGTLGEEKAVEIILKGANNFVLKNYLSHLPGAIINALKLNSEQKARFESDNKLRQSEQRFRGLIENSHDFILIFDENDIISYASPALSRQLGHSFKDLKNKSPKDLIHPGDLKNRVEKLKLLKSGEQKKVEIVQRWRKGDGNYFWMESVVSDQRNLDGINAFVSNIKDIDDYVITAMKLKEQYTLLDSVLNTLHEGIMVADLKGKILVYNPAAKSILGVPELEYMPLEFPESYGVLKEDKINRYKKEEIPFYRAINGNMVQDEVMYLKNELIPEGKYLRISATPFISYDRHYNGSVISMSDITQQKKYEIALNDTLQHLELLVDKRTSKLIETIKSLKEANKQITSSINYAKKIQQTITGSVNEINKSFKDSFMLYLPKDIVSGDFVWMYNGNNKFIAVADCTGHGVPGAMMSMIGFELLERIVLVRQIHRPEIILEELDLSVTRLLRGKEVNEVLNDGMDVSLCSVDYDEKLFYFSGANNDALFVNEDGVRLLRADRNSIGGFRGRKRKEFTRESVSFEIGDRLYLFTDGFQDQFGGSSIKKYSKKRLVEFIKSLQEHTLTEQGDLILKEFNSWKDEEFQIDDVTIVGLEF